MRSGGDDDMDYKKEVQNQFGSHAENYLYSSIHKLGKDLKKMLEITNFTQQDSLIDIATGAGHTANAYAPYVKEVTALDLTEQMLKVAKDFIESNGYENVRFVQGDAENLPFPNESFNIITCRIAPHHFPNIKAFISEVYRVLIPGGQFILNDNVAPERDEFDQFYNTVEKTRDHSHFRAWKKTEWMIMLEEQGFHIYECHRFEKVFHFENWCKRMSLSENEMNNLSDYMKNSDDQIKHKFKILENEHGIQSFSGEAIVLKAKKVR